MESKKAIIGTIFLAIGFAILLFSYIYFMTRPEETLSPVPYERPPKSIKNSK
ncbi:MAG: hypothetical protein U0525_04125 [Patescibacteria group bacterium]